MTLLLSIDQHIDMKYLYILGWDKEKHLNESLTRSKAAYTGLGTSLFPPVRERKS